MILLEIFLIHSIILGCIYFIESAMTLYKLTGSTLRPFTVGHCLGISLHLQTPCPYQPLEMLEPNMSQYKVCVCVLTGLQGRTVGPNYEVVEFQASVSDCSKSRLYSLLLYMFPIPSSFPNTCHSHHTGSSAHLGVPCLRPSISDFHTRSFAHLGV